jgi:hypothetical protein
VKEKIWTDLDELGFQMGDMHGEWKKAKQKSPTPTKPTVPVKKQEKEKMHIKRTGKK